MGETVVPRGRARAQQRPEAVAPAAVVLRVGCAETWGTEHEQPASWPSDPWSRLARSLSARTDHRPRIRPVTQLAVRLNWKEYSAALYTWEPYSMTCSLAS